MTSKIFASDDPMMTEYVFKRRDSEITDDSPELSSHLSDGFCFGEDLASVSTLEPSVLEYVPSPRDFSDFHDAIAKRSGDLDAVHAMDRATDLRYEREQRIKTVFSTKTAFTDYCRVARRVSNFSSRLAQVHELDESFLLDSSAVYSAVDFLGDEESAYQYSTQRSVEVRYLYMALGCVAHDSYENKFGSYRDIAIQAYGRRAEWSTNGIVSWLNSLDNKGEKWGSILKPYNALLPYLPLEVSSYLDYGAGNGYGATQLRNYLPNLNQVDVYDVDYCIPLDNQSKLNFLTDDPYSMRAKFDAQRASMTNGDVQRITNTELEKKRYGGRTYDLVTAVNVLHHIRYLEPVLRKMMDAVRIGGMLLIKDHFVSSTNVCLAVLVHEMYEPTTPLGVPEPLYFRDINSIRKFFLASGWTVDIRKLATDIGDHILICRNVKDGGRTQILELEERVNQLTQTVQDLSSIVNAKFNNPKYDLQLKSRPKNKAKHVAKVVANNDLSLPADRAPSKRPYNKPVKVHKDFEGNMVTTKTRTKSDRKSGKYGEVVTTEMRPKRWVPREPVVLKPNDANANRSYQLVDVSVSFSSDPSRVMSNQAEEVGIQRRRMDFSALSKKKEPPD